MVQALVPITATDLATLGIDVIAPVKCEYKYIHFCNYQSPNSRAGDRTLAHRLMSDRSLCQVSHNISSDFGPLQSNVLEYELVECSLTASVHKPEP
jgi:hypothetical protein